MNVYEEAHRLAQSVRESEEYKQYMDLKAKVDQNPELSNMLKDFQEKQINLQAQQFMAQRGEKPEGMEEMAQAMQQLSAILMADPLAAQYLQAQMRFTLMMNDVYKILGDVMGLGNLL